MAGEGGGVSGGVIVSVPKLAEGLGKLWGGGKGVGHRTPAETRLRQVNAIASGFNAEARRTGGTVTVRGTPLDRETSARYLEALARGVASARIGVEQERGTYFPPLPPTPDYGRQPTGRPNVVYSQQPGAPNAPKNPPIPDWQDVLWAVAQEGLQYWLDRRAAKDAARAASKWQRQLAAWLASLTAPTVGAQAGSTLMPYPITSFVPAGAASGGGAGGWLGALLGGISGAAMGLTSGSDLGYDVPYFPDVLVPDVIQRGMATSGSVGGPFGAATPRARAQKFLVPNPTTGALTWFGPLGEPVLWSRDFSAVRRVRKVGSKARRFCGGARSRGGR